ncbi:hypothetical protein EV11_0937 [Prochlorococcus sp. SS52]|nr:hypothetical protein EV04_0221 [Prochlorococcus marinus str. LG]KGG22058.1 hypothetical protein EV08_0232 [Prochlorococcus marinus str. SS2]KGG24624.1 hypothetical protein EV09_0256 [Prochlorococcus marinus str. SS35]KGG33517.1 hypothetical protein EV10_0726 [Prochlorococcus marinus str. SS51]KGG36246.1 hypothetical protein EV11_0937 [Prochlorococcus sp. SS52]
MFCKSRGNPQGFCNKFVLLRFKIDFWKIMQSIGYASLRKGY